jgi:hypothetical protein
MKSIDLLLDDAERVWRQEVKRDFPLRADTKIVRSRSKKGTSWFFFTDYKRIYADVFDEDAVKNSFEGIIPDYWKGDPEDLLRQTLIYLLYHELYHPMQAPFSVEGDKSDRKLIHEAIRDGILMALPDTNPLQQLTKVSQAYNMVTDFILDNVVDLDNTFGRYFREDIIPTWDMLELEKKIPNQDIYTISRLIYAFLYGPPETYAFFRQKAKSGSWKISKQALEALVQEPVKLPKGPRRARLEGCSQSIRRVFAGDDRYEGIKRFMAVLAPYIKPGMSKNTNGMMGGNGSAQNLLQDLLDGMTPEEQAEFVQSLANESPESLEQAAMDFVGEGTVPTDENEMQQDGKPKPSEQDGKPGGKGKSRHGVGGQMSNIDVFAAHEYYKLNHPKVTLLGGQQEGVNLVVGKREYWSLKRTTILTEDHLNSLNMARIDRLQRKSRIPWLIDIGNGTFRLNEYVLKEKEIRDIAYRDSKMDVPDFVEFYLDSSGSMYNESNDWINDGYRWDMLCHVFYGFLDALVQGGRVLRKQTKIRIHNFAASQVDTQLMPVNQYWNGDTEALRVMFKPDNGGATNLYVEQHKHSGRTAYVICSDGDMYNSDREAATLKSIAKDPKNRVVVFEIGGTYDLGRMVDKAKNIAYHQVHDKERMLEKGLEVLLSR